jgi:hypothetical protein
MKAGDAGLCFLLLLSIVAIVDCRRSNKRQKAKGRRKMMAIDC